MNFEEYVESVLNEIRARADKKYDIKRKDMPKNNGVKLTGIAFTTEKGGPCVYLDDFYREYENGRMKLSETVDRIYNIFMESLDALHGIDLSGFSKWKTVKGSIHAKLVNAEQNKDMLDTVPHRMFLDLAVLYYAVVGESEDRQTGTILINNNHMEQWGQKEGDLYRQAMENMRAAGEPFFRDMQTVICGLLLQDDADALCDEKLQPDAKLYVLTNRRKWFGAAEILDKSTLQMIADKIGDGFIVLPSSVHEIIILPPKDRTEYGKLADMVREVNDTQLVEEERLSYHVYEYNRNEELLKIAV